MQIQCCLLREVFLDSPPGAGSPDPMPVAPGALVACTPHTRGWELTGEGPGPTLCVQQSELRWALGRCHQLRYASVCSALGWRQTYSTTCHGSCHQRALGEAEVPREVGAWQ